jgi:hypothetical protein
MVHVFVCCSFGALHSTHSSRAPRKDPHGTRKPSNLPIGAENQPRLMFNVDLLVGDMGFVEQSQDEGSLGQPRGANIPE